MWDRGYNKRIVIQTTKLQHPFSFRSCLALLPIDPSLSRHRGCLAVKENTFAAGSTVELMSQIMFYKSRCNEMQRDAFIRSGRLHFMESAQKNMKVRYNISELHSVVPAQYNIYAHAIEAAVREYAARFSIVL